MMDISKKETTCHEQYDIHLHYLWLILQILQFGRLNFEFAYFGLVDFNEQLEPQNVHIVC